MIIVGQSPNKLKWVLGLVEGVKKTCEASTFRCFVILVIGTIVKKEC